MNYTWNLKEIYKNEKEFEKDIKECESLSNTLFTYKGKIMKDENTFYSFLSMFEKLMRLLSKLGIYATLNYYSNTKDSYFKSLYIRIETLIEIINLKLSFSNSEILKSDYSTIKDYIKKNKELKKYDKYLEKIFRFKTHTLSESEEEIITSSLNAMGSCAKAYESLNNADITLGYIKDESGNKVSLNHSNYHKYITSKKQKIRSDAFNLMHNFYKNHINTISSLYLGNIKEDFFISSIRKYKSPLEMKLYVDKLDMNLYDNLINSIHDNLPLLHKYLKIKKEKLKLKEMHIYDVYVNPIKDIDKNICYKDAIEIIMNALKPLGKVYLKDAKKGLNDWIDLYPKEGKLSGAYSTGSYDTLPYMSINYENDYNSVSTVIHELGHSMHTYYSNKTQSYPDASYPIFLAEIASTVNEILLSNYMLNNTKDKNEKEKYIIEFLEKVRTTIFRQVMFAEFEKNMYDKYLQGIPLTVDEMCETYYKLNKLYFGKDIIVDDLIKYEWARIPHFYTSFYVYKYATGFTIALIIVNKLKDESFKDKYIKFLESGGSDYPLNILKKLDITLDRETFNSAFKIFNEYINLLERK